MNDRYTSRKFILAVFFSLASTVGLYFGHITDSNYVIIVGLVLGLYGGSNVMAKSKGDDLK